MVLIIFVFKVSGNTIRIIITFMSSEELPETQNYAVKDNNTFEVKTAVIETLDIETDEGKSAGFKKRRARNIRKKTES